MGTIIIIGFIVFIIVKGAFGGDDDDPRTQTSDTTQFKKVEEKRDGTYEREIEGGKVEKRYYKNDELVTVSVTSGDGSEIFVDIYENNKKTSEVYVTKNEDKHVSLWGSYSKKYSEYTFHTEITRSYSGETEGLILTKFYDIDGLCYSAILDDEEYHYYYENPMFSKDKKPKTRMYNIKCDTWEYFDRDGNTISKSRFFDIYPDLIDRRIVLEGNYYENVKW